MYISLAKLCAATALATPVLPAVASPFHIVITPGPTLSANPQALLAFQAAAQLWEDRIVSPITINITADFGDRPAGVIGSSAPVVLQGDYSLVAGQLIASKVGTADEAITAALPSIFSATLPPGKTLDNQTLLTKADAKAMGFQFLDSDFGPLDGTITFSNDFPFDFDRSDGIDPGTIDFETVAAHEIGHNLGFLSGVDDIVTGFNPASPYPMDFYRFAADAQPQSLADFTNFPRDLMPGSAADFSDINDSFPLSTGLDSQASHWKANELTGQFVGIMDPTTAFQEIENPTAADFRALELIGYTIIPEPATGMCALPSLIFVVRHRRRRI